MYFVLVGREAVYTPYESFVDGDDVHGLAPCFLSIGPEHTSIKAIGILIFFSRAMLSSAFVAYSTSLYMYSKRRFSRFMSLGTISSFCNVCSGLSP